MDLLADLAGTAPAAAAVIVVVAMFLRFMREERKARCEQSLVQRQVLEKIRETLQQLALEIREQSALARARRDTSGSATPGSQG